MLDYQNLGTHGLAGLIGALLSWLGFRDRLNRHDDRLATLELQQAALEAWRANATEASKVMERLKSQVAALDAGRAANSETARGLAELKDKVVYSREWEYCRQESEARATTTSDRLNRMDAAITREGKETREEIRDITRLVNQLLQRKPNGG